jgi:hypothetical protein
MSASWRNADIASSLSSLHHDRRRQQRQQHDADRRPIVIASSPRRARQRHDGGRRSRHVSDPQPGPGGWLEAAHSVPPEIRTCDRRPRQANAVLQDRSGQVRITPSVCCEGGITSSRHQHDGDRRRDAAHTGSGRRQAGVRGQAVQRAGSAGLQDRRASRVSAQGGRASVTTMDQGQCAA